MNLVPLLLLASLCSQPNAAGVHWICGQSEDLTRIVCIADADQFVAFDSAPGATTAVVKGTRFPLEARKTYTVDMWAPATEPEEVERLARATICYRSPGCELTFSSPTTFRASYRIAASQ